jgi:hypothetical protein
MRAEARSRPYSLEGHQVLFRCENAPEVDFPALEMAIGQLHPWTVDVDKLRKKNSSVQFLGELVANGVGKNRPDALIFVGPKTTAEFAERAALKELGDPGSPVFYLNYNADPISNPWQDQIGSAVKVWKGFEHTISKPLDLFLAWDQVMSRISANGRGTSAADRAASFSRAPKK